jgi:hypothetical protein
LREKQDGFLDKDKTMDNVQEHSKTEDGDRTQFPKRSVLKKKQDSFLDKDKTMDNVQEQQT